MVYDAPTTCFSIQVKINRLMVEKWINEWINDNIGSRWGIDYIYDEFKEYIGQSRYEDFLERLEIDYNTYLNTGKVRDLGRWEYKQPLCAFLFQKESISPTVNVPLFTTKPEWKDYKKFVDAYKNFIPCGLLRYMEERGDPLNKKLNKSIRNYRRGMKSIKCHFTGLAYNNNGRYGEMDWCQYFTYENQFCRGFTRKQKLLDYLNQFLREPMLLDEMPKKIKMNQIIKKFFKEYDIRND